MQNFFDKNKVFILGLLSAIALAITPFTQIVEEEVKIKTVAFAVAMSVLAYLAKNWRGQGMSIIGIVGNLAGVAITVLDTGKFSMLQFTMQAILAIIAAAGANPKSVGYEKSEVIKTAKREGEKITPANLTAK